MSDVDFRSQDTLATAGAPVHVLGALGYTGAYPIARADLDGILDDWVASTGGTLRECDNLSEWQAAVAATEPGDLTRATTGFDPGAAGDVRGNRFGISGATLTASPAGGTEALPMVFTCADGVFLDDNNQSSDQGVIDFANCTHVWPVGMNVREGQFGIRHQNWGGTEAAPAYSAYNVASETGDACFLVAGWFESVAGLSGKDDWGYSEWFVQESNTAINPGNRLTQFGECFYFGRGSNPEWVAHARNGWVRGNLGTGYTADGFDIKPGCHRIRFTDNIVRQGAGHFGSGWQVLYLVAGADARPAWADEDPQIFIEGAIIYDHNLTKNQGSTSPYAMTVGMCGVTIANCITYSIADSFETGTGIAVQVRSEVANSELQSSDLEQLVIVNNLMWTGIGINNIGGPAVSPVAFPVSYRDFRNNLGQTATTGVEFNGTSADFVAPSSIPSLGDNDANANDDDAGPGSAFDLDPGSSLVGTGTSISDVDLFIDADISQRPIS